MAVFRVKKNANYTVMSNHHLRNKELSLKAKGLLSQMLSLPENWDYTLRGLAAINKESVDAIRSAIRELEQAGYISRKQTRDSKGRMSLSEYTIYEIPHIEPMSDKSAAHEPIQEKSVSENPTELNKDISSKETSNTDLLNTQSNHISGMIDEMDTYRELIKQNIDYDILCGNHQKSDIDEIVDILTEAMCSNRKTIRASGEDYPASVVKSKLLKLNYEHIEYVLDCMNTNTTQIRNIKQYMLTALFNAPSTINRYYASMVNHDFYGGGTE